MFCGNSAPCGVCRACTRGHESLCEDLLYLLGGFAEQVLVPPRIVERNLHRVPDGLDLQTAALAEPLACVVHALDVVAARARRPRGGARRGLARADACARCSPRPAPSRSCSTPTPSGSPPPRSFGAAETVQATRGPADAERVRELTEGRGADLVVEAVGRPEAWELAVAMAAPGGTVNLFGGCARDSTFTVPTARVHYDQVTLTGTYHHAPRYLARALEILAEHAWPWPELCGPVIDLGQLPDALAGRLHDPPPAKYTVLPS